MKSIKITAILALVSLSAIATAVKPASAQTGTDPWNGNVYDISKCGYSNSAFVDRWGTVYCSDELPDDYTYYNGSVYHGEFRQLQ